jgi:magnesium-transporting ATPase (P-type)
LSEGDLTPPPPAAHIALANRFNMIYSGTMVTSGSCLAVVTGTGALTEIGRISTGVEQAREHHMKTPLAEKLDVFSGQLSKIVLFVCILVFVVNVPKFSDKSSFSTPLQGAIHYLKTAVALGVAAIPGTNLPTSTHLSISVTQAAVWQDHV